MTDFTEFLYKTIGGKIKVKQGTWVKVENHKIYAKWLKEKLRYENEEDWYKITVQQIKDYHGRGLLINYYNGSPQQFINAMFPHYEWKLYKFRCTPMGHWGEIKNRKDFANDLGKYLGYTNMEDWYKITLQQIKDYHGGGLLREYYNHSPRLFVIDMFPKYEWKGYKFSVASNGYWDKIENKQEYANDLGKHLGYTKMEHWYQITKQKISEYYGSGLLDRYNNSPQQFVNAMFPDYPWINSKFKKNYSQGQIEWLKYMCVSTPDICHILNHDDGEYKIPGSHYYADGYSDEELCIFEYHGDYWHGNPKIYNQEEINKSVGTTFGECYEKTLEKQRFCEETGYNYVSIWESEWIRAKLAVIKIQQKWKNKK